MKTIRIIVTLIFVFTSVAFAQLEVITNSENNCLQCHQDNFTGQNTHFIENSDDCQFCHEVSSQENNHKTMTFASNTLCVSCHFDIDKSTQLLKHDSFDCVSCHNPHGSEYEYSMKNSTVALCSDNCHTKKDLGLSHPIGKGVADKHAGGDITCVSTCHTNHKPADEKMLQLASNNLCGQCHIEKY